MKVTIIDYGMGNIWSVKNSFEFVGATVTISSCPELIESADCLVLPGVGSFGAAMNNIQSRNLAEAMEYAVCKKGIPLLGICLGMQLLADGSEESLGVEGLGWVSGEVLKFKEKDLRMPHMGFNGVAQNLQSTLAFKNIENGADFYFVHSYHFCPSSGQDILSTTEYGIVFVSAVMKDNIIGVQFHPEKSQSHGLQFLSNFIKFSKTC